MSAVNLSEVVAKLQNQRLPEAAIRSLLDGLPIAVIDFSRQLAYLAGFPRAETRRVDLGFGDRACLALAEEPQAVAVTADKMWANLSLGITVDVTRSQPPPGATRPARRTAPAPPAGPP